MKEQYHEIYESLYKDYVYEQDFIRRKRPFHLDEYYITKTIKKSIERADRENRLRPDAKYFLIVNFHHLIVRPLIEERPYRSKFQEERIFDLEDSIHSDIETIINSSLKTAENKEVSGHQIMRTIDKLWKELRTTKLELWG